jgi:hypothetical protein
MYISADALIIGIVVVLFILTLVCYCNNRFTIQLKTNQQIDQRKLAKIEKRLHFALLATGTRGDVQPFVALGEELCSRGHYVRVCAHERFRSLVLRLSLQNMTFFPAKECDYFEANTKGWIESKTLKEFIRRTSKERSDEHEQNQRAFMRCCLGGDEISHLPCADVIVSSQFTREPAVASSDYLNIPLWSINLGIRTTGWFRCFWQKYINVLPNKGRSRNNGKVVPHVSMVHIVCWYYLDNITLHNKSERYIEF